MLQKRLAAEAERAAQQRLQRKLGTTLRGDAVDIGAWQFLIEMGFSRPLAQEALRQHNNNRHAALSALVDADARAALEVYIHSKAKVPARRHRQQVQALRHIACGASVFCV